MPIQGTLTGSFSFANMKGGGGAGITATGGTVSTWNGYTIHTFTSNGTFSVSDFPTDAVLEYMVVGGGGPGGNGLAGGGGGGAVVHSMVPNAGVGNYTIVVAQATGRPGDRAWYTGSRQGCGFDSTLTYPNGTVITAEGGGQGGHWDSVTGRDGGCGGGGSNSSNNTTYVDGGNTRQPGYGSRGGKGQRYPDDSSDNDHRAGGGGGAGGGGRWTCGLTSAPMGNSVAGATGGMGYYTNFDGTARYWAGGGGGSCWTGQVHAGNGGLGGGGGGNHQNDANKRGTGGGSALNTGGDGNNSSHAGDGGANTGGGGGGSFGTGWGPPSGGTGGSGIVMLRYRTDPTQDLENLGLTEGTAAQSAWAIKSAWNTAPTGTYWIKPSSSAPAYKVHCIMDIEGGGWELACRTNSWDMGPVGSGTMGGTWSGWGWTTKAQCDSLNTSYERPGDTECISPSFCYQNFKDVMMIANNDYGKRMGHRWNSEQSPITTILNNNGTNKANSELFGGKNLLSLDVRQETNNTYSGGSFFGFNVYGDTGSGAAALYGGQPDNSWGWAKAQIGVGRDNTNSNHFGGGMGATAQGDSNTFNGHWWGHGSGRNGHYWGGELQNGWYGHSVYIRRN